jgi:hypothetical protein
MAMNFSVTLKVQRRCVHPGPLRPAILHEPIRQLAVQVTHAVHSLLLVFRAGPQLPLDHLAGLVRDHHRAVL